MVFQLRPQIPEATGNLCPSPVVVVTGRLKPDTCVRRGLVEGCLSLRNRANAWQGPNAEACVLCWRGWPLGCTLPGICAVRDVQFLELWSV
jgi:hypothetical protein